VYRPYFNLLYYVCVSIAADGADDAAISILERGEHRLPFDFALPDQCLPGSFESRVGTVRYYLRVIIDIPYASPPQGLKYFTVIGPHIDCNDDKYAVSLFPFNAITVNQSKKKFGL